MSDGAGTISEEARQRQVHIQRIDKIRKRRAKHARKSQPEGVEGMVKSDNSPLGVVGFRRDRAIVKVSREVGCWGERVMPAWWQSLAIIVITTAVCAFTMPVQTVETIRYIEVERPSDDREALEFSDGLKYYGKKK